MSQDLISIVVPVYNVELYLNQCIESIVKQTYTNLEIILVDDGSPDNCPELCDQWEKRDSRIRVIHQKNAGLGPARNSGLQAAKGKYIGFVDSDDWVSADMYEKLYVVAEAKQADIVVSGHQEVRNGKIIKKNIHPLAGTVLQCKEDILAIRKNLYGHGFFDKSKDAFPMSACMSLYRRSMLEEQHVKFENIISEDIIFNLRAYKVANCIAFTGAVDYCYRKEGQASITYSLTAEKQRQYEVFLSKLVAMAQQEDEDCCLRARRTAIDYCRLYAEVVINSCEPIYEKILWIKKFIESTKILSLCQGYPIQYLPIQQRIFHWAISHKQCILVLVLIYLRQSLKRLRYRMNEER